MGALNPHVLVQEHSRHWRNERARALFAFHIVNVIWSFLEGLVSGLPLVRRLFRLIGEKLGAVAEGVKTAFLTLAAIVLVGLYRAAAVEVVGDS